MFRTGSPYSPFFMSGLLPSHSANVPHDEHEYLYEVDFRRRGSLPDTSSPTPSVAQFYKERSFLSLDLAGAGSLSAPSINTLRSRPSQQNLPSQKPIPKYADALPALPSSSKARASSALLPPNSIAGPSKPASSSNLKRNVSTRTAVSTVSSNFRRSKRSDALARLEGRTKAAVTSSFKFGSIKEERTSNFMSLSDDEQDSSEDVDEWDMDSDEDADFVDLGLDFSSHRYSYSESQNDEEDILPISPSRSHPSSFRSFFSTGSLNRTRSRRSKRSLSSFGIRSQGKSEPPAHSRTKSMMAPKRSDSQYTSFMDLDRPASISSSDFRPKLRRLSISAKQDSSVSLLSPTPKKTDEWLQWNSFIEISGVA
ncbi:hypothetical protein GYMLUDRAFT_51003 [Collybiopsis luxurians FD-317 M1]|uniref:Uncharacterized protein n=1 Tax=Collybiopsis luxurians FD-317 M1 TaxID=944289 RepID=A0A0D0B985_9AGAR|nr:hypothetical protein GYMLUDRAFT_51003 [Collybiopsis luxurians FD-317 M1]